MRKWIVYGGWHCKADPSPIMHPMLPVICNSKEEAMMEVAELLDYDLAGIDYQFIDSERWEWVFYLCDGIKHIATVGPNWVHIYDPFYAIYQIREMEI